jgi:hypothetical protein
MFVPFVQPCLSEDYLCATSCPSSRRALCSFLCLVARQPYEAGSLHWRLALWPTALFPSD